MRTMILGLMAMLAVTVAGSVFGPAVASGQGSHCEDTHVKFDPEDGVKFSSECKGSTWKYKVDGNGRSYLDFHLSEKFRARKGPKIDPDEAEAFCVITLTPIYPKGCTFSPSKISFQGHVKIQPEHKASLEFKFYDLASDDEGFSYGVSGITDVDSNTQFKVDLYGEEGERYWAPCGGNTKITIATMATIEKANQADEYYDSQISVRRGFYVNRAKFKLRPCKKNLAPES